MIENEEDLEYAKYIAPTPGCEEYDYAAIREAAKKIKL